MEINDCLIVGAGPAGIKAANILFDAGKKIVLFNKGTPGGKTNIAPLIVNYPGIPSITGPDFAMSIYRDIFYKGINFVNDEVLSIEKEDNIFLVKTEYEAYLGRSILVATGTKEKYLGLDHDTDWIGKGVSYCALCDAHFYRNQDVAVIVGDMHALKEALHLTSFAKKVYVISSNDTLTGDIRSYNELVKKDNVKFLFNKEMTSYLGKDHLEGITLLDKISKEKTKLTIQGLFPLIGSIPNTSFLPNEILNEDKEIIFNEDRGTSIEGLFAAGDCLARKVHQIYLAEKDAEAASLSILKYLNN